MVARWGSDRPATRISMQAPPETVGHLYLCVIGVLWTVMQRRPDSSEEAYIEAFVVVRI